MHTYLRKGLLVSLTVRLILLGSGVLSLVLVVAHGLGHRSAPSVRLVAECDRRTVPDLRGTGPGGDQITLSEYRGRIVLLYFWTPDCAHCASDLPSLNAIETKYRANGVAVLGVSLDQRAEMHSFLAAHPITFRVLLGDPQVIPEDFGGVSRVPLAILLDRGSRIAAMLPSSSTYDDFDSVIAALLKWETKQ